MGIKSNEFFIQEVVAALSYQWAALLAMRKDSGSVQKKVEYGSVDDNWLLAMKLACVN